MAFTPVRIIALGTGGEFGGKPAGANGSDVPAFYSCLSAASDQSD